MAGFERASGAFARTAQALPLDQMPIARRVPDEGPPVVLPDVQALPLAETVSASVSDPGFHAVLVSPLKARGKDVAAALENAWLSGQALAVEVDAERQPLARDLHDSVTQSLCSLTLLGKGWGTMAAQGRLENPVESFRRLSQVGQQARKEMRLLLLQLRLPILKEVGPVAALRPRLEAEEQRAIVEACLLTEGDIGDLPDKVEEQLFHIAQEALNNALRHAAATEVIVRIEVEANEVLSSVQDNGIGLDLNAERWYWLREQIWSWWSRRPTAMKRCILRRRHSRTSPSWTSRCRHGWPDRHPGDQQGRPGHTDRCCRPAPSPLHRANWTY